MIMKKIMFNDDFLLTQAVLEGRKTQTRRICKEQIWAHSDIVSAANGIYHFESPKYKVGEVVAVAQSYEASWQENASAYHNPYFLKGLPGWKNKMFVAARDMPHQIRITDVRVERLQDISDEDCLKEGVVKDTCKTYFNGYTVKFSLDQYNNILSSEWFRTPREAFSHLINKVSKEDVWKENPYVFVYDFELIR